MGACMAVSDSRAPCRAVAPRLPACPHLCGEAELAGDVGEPEDEGGQPVADEQQHAAGQQRGGVEEEGAQQAEAVAHGRDGRVGLRGRGLALGAAARPAVRNAEHVPPSGPRLRHRHQEEREASEREREGGRECRGEGGSERSQRLNEGNARLRREGLKRERERERGRKREEAVERLSGCPQRSRALGRKKRERGPERGRRCRRPRAFFRPGQGGLRSGGALGDRSRAAGAQARKRAGGGGWRRGLMHKGRMCRGKVKTKPPSPAVPRSFPRRSPLQRRLRRGSGI